MYVTWLFNSSSLMMLNSELLLWHLVPLPVVTALCIHCSVHCFSVNNCSFKAQKCMSALKETCFLLHHYRKMWYQKTKHMQILTLHQKQTNKQTENIFSLYGNMLTENNLPQTRAIDQKIPHKLSIWDSTKYFSLQLNQNHLRHF